MGGGQILSGLSTEASWICYFKSLSMGDVNKVVPIDKFNTILTVLLAIVFFGETNNLAVKLLGTVILAVGEAVFAALISILAKIGITGVESSLETAIRTGVVLIMAWIIVFLKGKQVLLKEIDRKEL